MRIHDSLLPIRCHANMWLGFVQQLLAEPLNPDYKHHISAIYWQVLCQLMSSQVIDMLRHSAYTPDYPTINFLRVKD